MANNAKVAKFEETLKRYLGRYVEVYSNGVDGYTAGVLEEIVDGWIIIVLGEDIEYMYNISNISLIKAVERKND